TGYHTLMALVPSYRMAAEEKDEKRRPLAVFKVLYRNSTRLQEKGGRKAEVLRPVPPPTSRFQPGGEHLRDMIRQNADIAAAEQSFAVMCPSPEAGLNALMYAVDDSTDVHRVVLVSRSWDLLDFVGKDRAHTLLRQSVHYCVAAEKHPNQVKRNQPVRDLLP